MRGLHHFVVLRTGLQPKGLKKLKDSDIEDLKFPPKLAATQIENQC
jgi:hypothetical protein